MKISATRRAPSCLACQPSLFVFFTILLFFSTSDTKASIAGIALSNFPELSDSIILPAIVQTENALPISKNTAGAEPLLGEIILFAGNFAPRGWAFCDGQLLAVSNYSALFSLLGTTYGGDGRTTFALPDLRGRVPVHAGRGPGLPNMNQGQKGGAEEVKLRAGDEKGVQTTPYLGVRYIIAIQGVYPSRN